MKAINIKILVTILHLAIVIAAYENINISDLWFGIMLVALIFSLVICLEAVNSYCLKSYLQRRNDQRLMTEREPDLS